MSGYELQYDAGSWYPLPDPAGAADFGQRVAAALAAERPDLTAADLDTVRAIARAAVEARPSDASESFLYLPADVGALGIVHLVVVVPGADEVYSADDLLEASSDALLPAVRTDVAFENLGAGARILAVTPGADAPPAARIEYLFADGPAVLMVSALARSVRDAGILTAAVDDLLGSFRWLGE